MPLLSLLLPKDLHCSSFACLPVGGEESRVLLSLRGRKLRRMHLEVWERRQLMHWIDVLTLPRATQLKALAIEFRAPRWG